VVIPGRYFDFVSRINGVAYRILLGAPAAERDAPLPVLYLLDGERAFPAAQRAVREGSVVVGIGYPRETGRNRDYTPVGGASRPEGGGVNLFWRVVLEEVVPFVESRHRIDPARRAVFGNSLGGLAVLTVLFRQPNAFTDYVISSPSIWVGNRAILADESAFSSMVKRGEVSARVLILSASDEQYLGGGPEKRARADTKDENRMIENASELAERLAVLNPEKLKVVRQIIPDEVHATSSMAGLNRAMSFVRPTTTGKPPVSPEQPNGSAR
jgi:predicted alpha/beta superfamily hydrolase